jgi:hypothetical protein
VADEAVLNIIRKVLKKSPTGAGGGGVLQFFEFQKDFSGFFYKIERAVEVKICRN